jgi:NAD(P)-dependent dehydrogenase (short-subunit alcohol dehydrogenase family)
MSGQMQGRVALVTGAASGIGRAAALAFARAGALVVVADLAREGGGSTVGMVRAGGGEATFVACDVSRAAEVEALIERTVATYGRLDCAFNNAGIGIGHTPLHELDEERWQRVLATNLTGVWLCMKYEIRQMLRQGGGAIVNTASIDGLSGARGLADYVASKHGVIGLTKTAALEYATAGIRVNAICPGMIRTPLVENALKTRPELEAQLIAEEPVGRMGTPEEIAAAALWLCSDAASFVTGHPMVVDGGFMAR